MHDYEIGPQGTKTRLFNKVAVDESLLLVEHAPYHGNATMEMQLHEFIQKDITAQDGGGLIDDDDDDHVE
jgi:hypothetical protein